MILAVSITAPWFFVKRLIFAGIKKKIALSDGMTEKKEIIRMKQLIFESEEGSEIFNVPPKMRIMFGEATKNVQKVADSAGKLFIKSISDY